MNYSELIIKVYDSLNKTYIPKSKIGDFTFFDENGILKGKQRYYHVEYEIKITPDYRNYCECENPIRVQEVDNGSLICDFCKELIKQ